MEWLPIETAPKDATPVDIWRPAWGGVRCTNMQRNDLGNGNVFYSPVVSGYSCVRDATHWMPIPEAPQINAPRREVPSEPAVSGSPTSERRGGAGIPQVER